jgi:hypothetical protein
MAKKTLDASLVGIQYQKPPIDVYANISNHQIVIRRDRNNQHDINAVEVILLGHKVGYINKDAASVIALLLDKNYSYTIKTKKFTYSSKSIGLNIEFLIPDPSIVVRPNLQKIAGIYQISINRKDYVYIGQSININDRIKSHWNDLEFNSHVNKRLQDLWNENNPSSFEVSILETVPLDIVSELQRQRWLADREKYWIKKSREQYKCLNITDGEIVPTKIAVQEYQTEKKLHDKQHDQAIREEKKILKIQIDKSLNELSAERAKLENILREIKELSKFISKNTGIIGFFTGTAPKSVVAQKEKLLQDLCSRNKIQQELVNKMYSEYSGLRNRHRQLKTTKQINNATNKFLFRAGINPYRNKPEIE